jgi:uncharacterized membrane protein
VESFSWRSVFMVMPVGVAAVLLAPKLLRERAAMLAGGLAAALAMVVAWRASTQPRLRHT